MMENPIWGQGFPQPVFCDTFGVESQRIVGGKHTKLRLVKDGRRIEAIWFNSLEALPARARTVETDGELDSAYSLSRSHR